MGDFESYAYTDENRTYIFCQSIKMGKFGAFNQVYESPPIQSLFFILGENLIYEQRTL